MQILQKTFLFSECKIVSRYILNYTIEQHYPGSMAPNPPMSGTWLQFIVIIFFFQLEVIYFNLEDFLIHNRHIEINRELDKVNTWLKLNNLSLNVDKNKMYDFP